MVTFEEALIAYSLMADGAENWVKDIISRLEELQGKLKA